ncbi:hypothetical protein EV175_000608 [Coemansia sp. RSA 1933]|nr:hypothetical protein EV175_000608 [Coemansia sp. RSA 1933]
MGIIGYIKLLNYKYELLMGHYVLDYWEKVVVNIIVAACIAFVIRMLLAILSLKKLNYQYEVTTGLYMLESWEKYIVNGAICASFALLTYTAINHLPTHSASLMNHVSDYMAA